MKMEYPLNHFKQPQPTRTVAIPVPKNNTVLNMSPAFDNSFALIVTDSTNLVRTKNKLRHIDAHGKTLMEDVEISFNNNAVLMLNDHEVLFESADNKSLKVFSLRNKKVVKERPLGMPDCQKSIETFSSTKLVCVIGRSKKAVQIAYYNYDELNAETPVAQWEHSQKDSPLDLAINKIDESSGIVWCHKELNLDQNMSFTILTLDESCQLQMKEASTYNTIKAGLSSLSEQIQVLGIKKLDKDSFLVFGHGGSNKSATFFEVKSISSEEEGQSNRIRSCDKEWSEIPFGRCQLYNQFLILETNEGRSESYLIDFETRKTKLLLNHREGMIVTYCKVGWNERLLGWIEEKFDLLREVTQIHVGCKYIFEEKEFFLDLLLKINEDFDDDLLQDTLSLLQRNQ